MQRPRAHLRSVNKKRPAKNDSSWRRYRRQKTREAARTNERKRHIPPGSSAGENIRTRYTRFTGAVYISVRTKIQKRKRQKNKRSSAAVRVSGPFPPPTLRVDRRVALPARLASPCVRDAGWSTMIFCISRVPRWRRRSSKRHCDCCFGAVVRCAGVPQNSES